MRKRFTRTSNQKNELHHRIYDLLYDKKNGLRAPEYDVHGKAQCHTSGFRKLMQSHDRLGQAAPVRSTFKYGADLPPKARHAFQFAESSRS